MEGDKKGVVCVTGGTGYLASWLIKSLLEHGYSVNATIRSHPDPERDISYLTSLPKAPEKLRIFNADLDKPESFKAAIQGCVGVFHVAHPTTLKDPETEELAVNQSVNGTLGILQACLDSGTVKRVVYTSSTSAVMSLNKGLVDESCWTDVEFVRGLKVKGGSYSISKTLTEKAALEFAEKHGLDLVTVIPTWAHGPFLNPTCPGSVRTLMALVFGDLNSPGLRAYSSSMPLVHVDDVSRGHIFLFEYPNAKGRYICSALDVTVEKLAEFLSARYPEYEIPSIDTLKTMSWQMLPGLSSKKLLETGFTYKYGLEEMYDAAIECCKNKGIL